MSRARAGEPTTSLELLIADTRHVSAPIRATAARDMGALADRSPQATEALARLLGDGDADVRQAAMQAISSGSPNEALALLRSICEKGTAVERQRCMALVARLDTPSVLDVLAAGLSDADEATRGAAGTGLGRSALPDAGRLLRLALLDPSPIRRAAALAGLGQRYRDAGRAPEKHARDRQYGRGGFGIRVETGAEHFAAEGAESFPHMLAATGDPDPSVRAAAHEALKLAPVHAEIVVPILTSALADRRPEVRRTAIRALGGYGDAARSAAPSLVVLLRNGTRAERIDVLSALGDVDPGADAGAERTVIGIARGPDRDLQLAAVSTLGALHNDPAQTSEVLLDLTESLDDRVGSGSWIVPSGSVRALDRTESLDDRVRRAAARTAISMKETSFRARSTNPGGPPLPPG